jgi:hypothetical protein
MKPLLLGSTALICLGVTSGSAFAACSNTAPVTGETVTCTGTSTTPVVGAPGQTGITVNIANGAQLNAGNNKAVRLQGGGQINLFGNGSLSTTGAGGSNHAASIVDPSAAGGSSITLNDNSTITTSGPNGDAARIAGDNASINLNLNSAITLNGANAIGAQGYGNHDSVNLSGNSSITGNAIGIIGADITGNDGSVNLTGNSDINLTGATAWGVHFFGTNDRLSLGGNTSVVVHGNAAYGAYVFGSGDIITLNGNAGIRSYGVGANAVDIIGGNTILSLSGNAGISTSGNNAIGVKMTGGNGNNVTLNDHATLSTASSGAVGISLTGNQDSVALNGHGGVGTQGANAHGIYINGNNAAITLNGGSIETYGVNAIGAYVKGNNGTISLLGGGFIETNNTDAYGILGVGNYTHVTLGGTSQINTSGSNGNGVVIGSGSITLNDAAKVTTQNGAGLIASGTITLNGRSSVDVQGANRFGAYTTLGGAIVLNDKSTLSTHGAGGFGAFGKGAHSSITLTGAAAISTQGTNAAGIHADNNFATIRLSGTSSVTTLGSGAAGIDTSSFGGVTTGTIALNDNSAVATSGTNAAGILVKGDANTVTLAAGASVKTTGNGSNAVFFSTGSNTLSNAGTLNASSATAVLGDNNAATIDDISNFGTIIGNGTAIDLQAGNDTLTLGTGSQISGLINGGAGTDAVTLVGRGSDANVFQNWETLAMTGEDWSLSGTSTFGTSIIVQQGRLAINGAITSPVTTVQANGILGGSGTLTSNVTSTGTIAPGNSPGTLTIAGNFTQTGGAFDVEFDHSAIDRLNVTGAGGATLAGGPRLNIVPLAGATGGAGIILHATNGITGSFGTVNYQGNGAATLIQSANDITLLSVDGTPVVASDFAASQTGLDYLDDVAAEQIAGSMGCDGDACDRATKHLWGRGFGRFGAENAGDGNQGFDYRIAGTAIGGDFELAQGLKLGASFGYSNTEEDVSHHAASADIDSRMLALYANYEAGRFFLTGAVSGGWQGFDLSRQVSGGEADASTTGWLVGTSLQVGMKFNFPDGWLLTPSAGIAWQHQWVESYNEHGAGAADASIGSHQADALRMRAQLELSQTYHPTETMSLSPHLKVGIAEQESFGGTARGLFSDGTNFDLALTDNSRTIGLAGVGVDVAFADGLTTFVDYDGQLAGGRTVNAVIGGLRYSW